MSDELVTIQERIVVTYDYPVHFCADVFGPPSTLLDQFFEPLRDGADPCKVFVVIDNGVADAWPQLSESIRDQSERHTHWALVADPEVYPGGEQAKNDSEFIQTLYRRFQELGLDRHACVMVVGGGALIDAVGYAAATAHRGIRLLRLPTTVLSQNDAGVGVKNSVNALGSKNFLGTFAPPVGVINDLSFLRTLSPRDRRAGLAESVKVALVKDAEFYRWLVDHASELHDSEEDALRHSVIETARLHLDHIASGGDPFEMGRARPLDFGHWSAHKLESLSGHELRHGEAVSIGIALDVRYAVERGMLDASVGDEIVGLLEALGLPIYHEALDQVGEDGSPVVLQGLEEFRQHLGGELCVTQLHDVAKSVQVHEVSSRHVLLARDSLRARAT